MKRYRVRLAEDAEQDLIDIYRYITTHDSAEKAAHVLDQLELSVRSLPNYPNVAMFRPSWIESV